MSEETLYNIMRTYNQCIFRLINTSVNNWGDRKQKNDACIDYAIHIEEVFQECKKELNWDLQKKCLRKSINYE